MKRKYAPLTKWQRIALLTFVDGLGGGKWRLAVRRLWSGGPPRGLVLPLWHLRDSHGEHWLARTNIETERWLGSGKRREVTP